MSKRKAMIIQALQLLSLLAVLTLTTKATPISYQRIDTGEINGHSYQKYKAFRVDDSDKTISVKEWIESLLDTNSSSSSSLTETLSQIPYDAVYWEVAPITRATWHEQDLEFVVLDAKSLAKRKARFRSFEQPCSASDEATVCVFSNLSGDATLVVPRPLDETNNDHVYTHLAKFVRHGNGSQVEELWQRAGQTIQQALLKSTNPNENIWLSTAGNGVPWLHIRLDRQPKYYRYKPYQIPMVADSSSVESFEAGL